MQNWIPPPSFLARRIGVAAKDILGQINPLLKYLLIYFFITRSLLLHSKVSSTYEYQ